jgi:hypothetical protein
VANYALKKLVKLLRMKLAVGLNRMHLSELPVSEKHPPKKGIEKPAKKTTNQANGEGAAPPSIIRAFFGG